MVGIAAISPYYVARGVVRGATRGPGFRYCLSGSVTAFQLPINVSPRLLDIQQMIFTLTKNKSPGPLNFARSFSNYMSP